MIKMVRFRSKIYRPTKQEIDNATDELTEILADMDAKISPENDSEAYKEMHERTIRVQKILLGKGD
jgi:hypothetical protein